MAKVLGFFGDGILSNQKKGPFLACGLGFVDEKTAQLYGDYFLNHEIFGSLARKKKQVISVAKTLWVCICGPWINGYSHMLRLSPYHLSGTKGSCLCSREIPVAVQ